MNKVVFGTGMVVAVLMVLTVSVTAAAASEVSFVPDPSSALPGETTNVSIWLDSTEGVFSFDAEIHFDPTVVNITDASAGDFPMGFGMGHYGNYVILGGVTSDFNDKPPGRWLIANLTLKAENPGTSPLNFNPGKTYLGNQIGKRVPATWNNGTFTCGEVSAGIEIDLRADGINGTIIDAPGYTVNPGTVTEDGITINNQTAMGAVVAYCQDHGINVDITMGAYGEYLIQIGDDPADENNWMYAVDGSVPWVGGAQYNLSGGEFVHWYNYNLHYYEEVLVTVDAPDDCVDGAFTVNIEVDPHGQEVYGVQYDLTFDPDVIQITNMNAGSFLEEGGADTQVYINEYDNVAGTASFAETRKNTTSGATGPGVLTTISFVTVGDPSETSNITLSGVVVSDPSAQELETELTHDSVRICAANEPPNASARSNHIYNNVGTVYFCEAELDGSQSTDPDGTIVQYSWAFGDGQYGTGEVVKHKYGSYVFSAPSYTPFTATLTVTDDGGASDDDSCEVIVYIAGDANGDGTVNVLDATMVGLTWHQTGNPTGVAWPGNEMADRADLNNDRTVDILDAVIIGACWGNNA